LAARSTPPFRADHVGSLLRPPALLESREDFAAGRISANDLRAREDEAIRSAVQMQEELGLQVATDGEFRRTTWMADFVYQLGGVSPTETSPYPSVATGQRGRLDLPKTSSGAIVRVDGKVHLDHTIFGEDFTTLRSMTTTAVPKLTIPSPSMVHYRGGREAVDETVYPDLDDFWHDLSATYAAEVRSLADLGCTYLQLDDVTLAYLNDPAQRDYVAGLGSDPEHLHETYIRCINDALAGKPAGMTVAVHLCRGNMKSSWMAEGGYDFVAESLFNDLDVDGFFLEYDDERSGSFEPLRFVPKGKTVVLGLVTSKRGELERKDELKARIEEASRFVDPDQLCLSPQCGFASVVEGNAITYDEQVAKLGLVVETAREVWG
jgi:methionine synthase II (cobalamin-independent)